VVLQLLAFLWIMVLVSVVSAGLGLIEKALPWLIEHVFSPLERGFDRHVAFRLRLARTELAIRRHRLRSWLDKRREARGRRRVQRRWQREPLKQWHHSCRTDSEGEHVVLRPSRWAR
jgi:hypothetical protein